MNNFDDVDENDVVVKDKISKHDKYEPSNIVLTTLPEKVTREWIEAVNTIKTRVTSLFIMTPLGSFIVYRDGKLVEDGGLDEWNI